jgi:hypothetical protein
VSCLAYPSTSYLAEATGQDRKTVLANMRRLIESGYIEDSGDRAGSTRQVIVYRLRMPVEIPADKSPEIGTVANGAENGTCPKNGTVQTVPKTDGKSPKNGLKQSQKRDTEPSDTSGTKSEERQQQPRGTRLPERWRPSDPVVAWAKSEFPNANLRLIFDEFVDYWHSVPGTRGRKLDWDATFRNRVREVASRGQRSIHATGIGSRKLSAVERVEAAVEERRRERDQRPPIQGQVI